MVTPNSGCRKAGRFCHIVFKDLRVCYHFRALTNTEQTLTMRVCNLKIINGSKPIVAEIMKSLE